MNHKHNQIGKLSIVATPIGNLKDITLRALEALKEADLIAAEDTRQTRKLLTHYAIHTPLVSYHSYNKVKSGKKLIQKLLDQTHIALVTDSGTPCISDPGSAIIQEAIKEGIKIECLPGPTAVMTALILSGKDTSKFSFVGFLSPKSSRRKKELMALRESDKTIVLYESPHRIVKLLTDIHHVYGNIDIACMREMTKKFEETLRLPVGEIIERFEKSKPRGEFVVVI